MICDIKHEKGEKRMADFQISLASARVNAGMTQEEIAHKMGVSKKTIINWEKGNTSPSFAVIQMLSSIYGIPADYIFLQKKST